MHGLLLGEQGRKRRSTRRRHWLALGVVVLLVACGVLVWAPWGEDETELDEGEAGMGLRGNPARVDTPSGEGVASSAEQESISGMSEPEPQSAEPEPPVPGESGSAPAASSESPEPEGPEPAAPTLEPVEGPREPSDKAATLLAEVQRRERRGEVLKARALYAEAMKAQPNRTQRREIVERLEAVAGRTVLGGKIWPGDRLVARYEVRSGDVLSAIGRRFKIPYRLIMRLNSLPSETIYAGRELKVVQGPFRVRIVKETFSLELWLDEVLVRTFPVAIGKEGSTPAGTYEVQRKQTRPTFYPPPSQRGTMPVRGPDDPDNPLGTRWIGLGNHLGIHGTNEPDSIGKRVSLGCIRMHNRDVEFLYDCLVRDARVDIVEGPLDRVEPVVEPAGAEDGGSAAEPAVD